MSDILSKSSILEARINPRYRYEVFFDRILQDLIYTGNYRQEIANLRDKIKLIDPNFDFIPLFSIYLRQKQGEIPKGIYRSLTAYKNSLYNQPDQNKEDRDKIFKIVSKILLQMKKITNNYD